MHSSLNIQTQGRHPTWYSTGPRREAFGCLLSYLWIYTSDASRGRGPTVVLALSDVLVEGHPARRTCLPQLASQTVFSHRPGKGFDFLEISALCCGRFPAKPSQALSVRIQAFDWR